MNHIHDYDRKARAARRLWEERIADEAAGGWGFERCPDCGKKLRSMTTSLRWCPDDRCGWESDEEDIDDEID